MLELLKLINSIFGGELSILSLATRKLYSNWYLEREVKKKNGNIIDRKKHVRIKCFNFNKHTSFYKSWKGIYIV